MVRSERYYRVGDRLRVHGWGKDGRYKILRWEDVDTLEESGIGEGGHYKVVEWVFHFEPTNKDNKPSGKRNFEVRLRVPDNFSENKAQNIADDILAELMGNYWREGKLIKGKNEGIVDTSKKSKRGKDLIKFTKETPNIEWMMIDTMRPQYKYPKNRQWGEYLE